MISKEISKHGYVLKSDKISLVDASITDNARRPKEKAKIELESNRGSKYGFVKLECSEMKDSQKKQGDWDKRRQNMY